ncbi:uncharacterized protein ATNIH1004_001332 [Aspergillus tanneri]|uniref:O-methyltransferase domain-containing protein n=1 Tax=Aspergillus tanneri TaxID=1220188 RepID=A0A5M9N000_9EURO|nr:uncharacterized protein ATNIH1004_001332 [Aspergillus tanneri]KAA8652428.1 hypothetical protein ATNIH1004_001332 [Aspergillus tanneri]
MVTLAELAQEVQSHIAVIDNYLEHNLPQPTFDIDSPKSPPPGRQYATSDDVTRRLQPRRSRHSTADHLLGHQMTDKYDGTAMHFLAAFNVFDAVPKEDSILPTRSTVSTHRSRAMSHTRAIRLWQVIGRHVPGFSTTWKGSSLGCKKLVDTTCKWETLTTRCIRVRLGKGQVVTIDGYAGHLLSAVALAYPDLTSVIQTKFSPGYEKRFYENFSAELKGRVTCMAHDQYAEQPVKNADLYFMSTSLQEENQETDAKILATALMQKEQGVYDAGLGLAGFITRFSIGTDLQMMSVMNLYHCRQAEWVVLFKKADPPFELKKYIQTMGSCTSLMEWVLE